MPMLEAGRCLLKILLKWAGGAGANYFIGFGMVFSQFVHGLDIENEKTIRHPSGKNYSDVARAGGGGGRRHPKRRLLQ